MKTGWYWARWEGHEHMSLVYVALDGRVLVEVDAGRVWWQQPSTIAEWGRPLRQLDELHLPACTMKDVEHAQALIKELGEINFHAQVPAITVHVLWDVAAFISDQYNKMKVRAEAAEAAINAAIDASDNGGGSASDAIQDMLGILRADESEADDGAAD